MPNRNAYNALYLAKVETTDGTNANPSAAADAIQLIQPLDPALDYVFRSARPRLVKGIDINAQPPLRPRGLLGSWSPSAWFRGLGSAITSSNPIELDPWFQAAGYAASYSGGAGVEQVAYSLASSGLKTLSDVYNEDGIEVTRVGVRGELGLSLDVGGPLVVTFASHGRAISTPYANAIAASPTFKTAVPQVGSDLTTFSVDSFAAGVIRKFTYQTGNQVNRRDGMGAPGGIAGHRIDERAATWSVVLEEPTIAEHDLRNAQDSNTEVPIHWTLPGALYQSFDFLANHARIEKVTPSNDNGLALLTIEGGIYDLPQGTPVMLTIK